jgi:hypothetical protein
LADYPDISGEFVAQAVSRTTSVATQVAPVEGEGELETESDESEEEKVAEKVAEPQPQEPGPNDEFDGAVGMATILVFGGMLIAGAAYYLNQPILIEHPHSMREYF